MVVVPSVVVGSGTVVFFVVVFLAIGMDDGVVETSGRSITLAENSKKI